MIKQILKKFLFFALPLFVSPKKNKSNLNNIGVSMLLCHENILMATYSLMSLMYMTNCNFPVYIVDDGTLTDRDKKFLAKYFLVIINSVDDQNTKARDFYKRYPYLNKFRFDQKAVINKLKLDAYFLHPFEKVIYLDSDTLFFKKPKIIVNWMKSNKSYFLYLVCSRKAQTLDDINHQILNVFRKVLFKYLKNNANETFNSGIVCLSFKHGMDVILRKLNTNFKWIYFFGFERHWQAEETAMALLSGNIASEELPNSDYIGIFKTEHYEFIKSVNKKVFLHYAGPSKVFFAKDAIKLVLKTSFFS